jgi:RNA polymerase sigma-70 factor (ECF subfamily)
LAYLDIDSLFRTFGKDVLRFLRRRVSDPETAADLTQDAFVRLMSAGPGNDPKDIRAYLIRTAANLAIDHGRRQTTVRFVPEDEVGIDHIDTTPSPERHALSRIEVERLQGAIDELSPRCREVFLMARVEGLTYVEIGKRLGISDKTCFSHMVNALAYLKLKMQDSDDEPDQINARPTRHER